MHPIPPGPLKTRAASGLKDSELLLSEAAPRTPLGELVDIMDVGFTCAFLATLYGGDSLVELFTSTAACTSLRSGRLRWRRLQQEATIMTRLLLGNIEPGTSDDEILRFLEKYGFPVADSIQHAEGVGSRPAVVLTFLRADLEALSKLQPRIHNMYWKRRKLNAQILTDSFA